MKLMVAVDDTKGSRAACGTLVNMCRCMNPDEVILLHVEKFEGRSLMDEMLGDAEMSTLRDVLQGSEYKEMLDEKARRLLEFYQGQFRQAGLSNTRTVLRTGHPAEEIIRAAEQERPDMIVVGSRGGRTTHRFMGSVSREVAENAEVPVLVVKSKAQA